MSQDHSASRPSALVSINSVEIVPIIIREQRVLTLAQIDQVHQRPEGTAKRNFSENKSRLVEGQDWFLVGPDEIRTTSPGAISDAHRSKLTVVTESGYLLLVKSFTDDLAWQVQRELVNAYFRVNPERAVGERYDTLIPSEQQTLSEIVHHKVAHLPSEQHGRALAEIWSRLHRKFRIAQYSQLPRTQLADAILYVTQMQLRGVPNAPGPEDYERISAKQYSELTKALTLIGWLFQNQHHQTAVYDFARATLGVRRLKDIPADQFDTAMLLAEGVQARATIGLELGNEFLRWLTRDFIACNAPCTHVLARKYIQKLKREPPSRPNWSEVQRQLEARPQPQEVAS